MADVTIKILTPATTFDLLTLEEAKIALGLTDTSQDELLEQQIDHYSDWVATRCNRIFAKERVQETWRELGDRRLFLSHWPVKEADIEKVEAPAGIVLAPSTYELEERSGKLSLFGSRTEPIVVTYTGGFNLPDEAPDALKQSCELMVRADRAESQRQATSGIRTLVHKESRIMFFDPNASKGSSAGVSATVKAVDDILMHYVRLQV